MQSVNSGNEGSFRIYKSKNKFSLNFFKDGNIHYICKHQDKSELEKYREAFVAQGLSWEDFNPKMVVAECRDIIFAKFGFGDQVNVQKSVEEVKEFYTKKGISSRLDSEESEYEETFGINRKNPIPGDFVRTYYQGDKNCLAYFIIANNGCMINLSDGNVEYVEELHHEYEWEILGEVTMKFRRNKC